MLQKSSFAGLLQSSYSIRRHIVLQICKHSLCMCVFGLTRLKLEHTYSSSVHHVTEHYADAGGDENVDANLQAEGDGVVNVVVDQSRCDR